MKILFMAPYIYDRQHPEFSKTSSGFGYMVNDILRGISKCQDVYLITHQFTKGFYDTYMACRHTKWNVICGLRPYWVLKGCIHMFGSKACFSKKIRYLYYFINAGSIEICVKKIRPNIVHIHGLTYQTKPFIEICERLNLPYIVTLHGLNGIDRSVNLPEAEKRYEYKALCRLEKDKRTVTVVSTGIKSRVLKHYNLSGANIKVILNGTSFNKNKLIEKKDNEKKILLCVGTVSYRKNQLQLIRACKLIDQSLKKRLHVYIIGAKSEDIDLESEILKDGLNDIITYCGFVPREKMDKYWRMANFNVVMSESEGFGLSMIEGFTYGVPTITFSDIDAIIDLYNKDAVELINERTDAAVALTIKASIEKRWDTEKIIDWSKQFSIEAIVSQYNQLYKIQLKRRVSDYA